MAFLDGYRVLDLTDERGMLAGRILADLGADVVQVEPPGGSPARGAAPLSKDGSRSFFFEAYGANKRGMVIDLQSSAGRDEFRELVAGADFLIESAAPGEMARVGLDWPDLRDINPGLVHVSITPFGRTGPKAGLPWSDLVVWAAGGPLEPHRDGDRPPVRISSRQAFLHASADAVAGALLAHHARVRDGIGQHVDVSAQSSLGVATLARVLSDAAGDRAPDWEQPGTVRLDLSGSGAATPPAQKKWPVADGVVEFHISLGPAAGAFTNAFFGWMADEGQLPEDLARIDWRIVPAMLADGRLAPGDLVRAREAVGPFLAAKTMAEVLDAALTRRMLCVPIWDAADVSRSAHLEARHFWADFGGGARRRRLPARFVHSAAEPLSWRYPPPLLGEHTRVITEQWRTGTRRWGDRPGHAAPARSLPLDGLRVLDLSWVVAGPMVGRALADFGATVVRVESSKRPETARHMPPFHHGVPGLENSYLYMNSNAGKLGIDVDLSTPGGQLVIRELADRCDVVIEAFAPGKMRTWGLDYETLSAERGDLIMVSTAIMGQDGPLAGMAGFGNVGAALSGFQAIVGWPDRPAFGPLGPYTDYVAPRFSIATLLAALDYRRRTGSGCYLDVSQVEAGAFFLSAELAAYDAEGTVPGRVGNDDPLHAPNGVYPCRESERGEPRWIALTVTSDAQWRSLVRLMDGAGSDRETEFASAADRLLRRRELDKIIADWTSGSGLAELEASLGKAGIPAHRASSSHDFCTDPQLLHRGHLVRVPHQRHGSVVVEGPRYLLSETPGRPATGGPTLGQHTGEVLREILGYAPDRIERLFSEGAVR
jgi:crotonobetainyl-CoA:carnitine CoA-transferase CaiB-like acyl-CoA transferase